MILKNDEQKRNKKEEKLDKMRCARYLLDMIVKYGSDVKVEEKKND